MQDHVYKIVEIVGTSRESISAAIEAGLDRARGTLRNIRWFEVENVRGYIEPEGAIYYQATMKIGFTLDD